MRQLPNLEDTLQDIITYRNFDYGDVDDVILAMLKFIYTGHYDASPDFPDEWHQLYLHSRVYWLASSYNFQELKKYSEAKFALCVDHDLSWEVFMKEPHLLLGLVYDAPFDTSRGVRDVMIRFCARNAKKLGREESFYRDLEIPVNFWKEYALHLAGCPDLWNLDEH